jgi:hypothetical protein
MIVISETVDDEQYWELTLSEHELRFLEKNKSYHQKALVTGKVINVGIRVNCPDTCPNYEDME